MSVTKSKRQRKPAGAQNLDRLEGSSDGPTDDLMTSESDAGSTSDGGSSDDNERSDEDEIMSLNRNKHGPQPVRRQVCQEDDMDDSDPDTQPSMKTKSKPLVEISRVVRGCFFHLDINLC